MEEVVKYLKALLAMQVAIYEASEADVKAEVLLARAGLPYSEIASLTGRTYAGIAQSMSRAKRGGKR